MTANKEQAASGGVVFGWITEDDFKFWPAEVVGPSSWVRKLGVAVYRASPTASAAQQDGRVGMTVGEFGRLLSAIPTEDGRTVSEALEQAGVVKSDREEMDPAPQHGERVAELERAQDAAVKTLALAQAGMAIADETIATITRERDEARRELAEARGKAFSEAERACEVLACSDEVMTPADCIHAIRALATSSKGGGA